MPDPGIVVFDVDSTLVNIEGLDELAAHLLDARGRAAIEALTRDAMDGNMSMHEALSRRLAMLQPSRHACRWLAERYADAVVEGMPNAIASLAADGWKFAVVTGGLRDAVTPIVVRLFPAGTLLRLFAVDIAFDDDGPDGGAFRGLVPSDDAKGTNVTAQSLGKARAVEILAREHGSTGPIVVVGDGATDAEAAAAADAFVCFTAVVARPAVIARADGVVSAAVRLTTRVLQHAVDVARIHRPRNFIVEACRRRPATPSPSPVAVPPASAVTQSPEKHADPCQE